MRPARTAVAILLLVATLTGCLRTRESGDDPPDYTPLADSTLYTQIAGLPGVTAVDIEWRDEFGNSNTYVGTVTVDSSVDPRATLDHAVAILRQGRPDALMTVQVIQDGVATQLSALGISGTDPDLTERYGPQPGTGEPPE